MRHQEVSQLAERLRQSPFCRLVSRGELPCIEISHPAFNASILLQGAQIIAFAPTGEDNWLWLSEQAEFREGKSVRGGIPICWPWFGNPDRNPPEVQATMNESLHLPAHGFAREEQWQLTDLYEAADRIEVEMSLPQAHSRQPWWHGEADLRVRWVFNQQGFSQTLTTTNRGDSTLAISQALHTYLPTSDIHQTSVFGLCGASYLDTLIGWRRKQQTGAVTFSGETDRIYLMNDHKRDLCVHTPELCRRITATGSASAVVWNPWIKKSARLGQFPDDGWQRMLCVETANAADDWVNVPAQGEHSLTLSLSRG